MAHASCLRLSPERGICFEPRCIYQSNVSDHRLQHPNISPLSLPYPRVQCESLHVSMFPVHSIARNSQIRLVRINLPSHDLRRDAWNLRLLSTGRGPICPTSSRRNIFVCRSFLPPGGGKEVPVLKAASFALK
ncbi:hypothetical protein CRG98_006522, partial [Punica granatum]